MKKILKKNCTLNQINIVIKNKLNYFTVTDLAKFLG